MKKIAILGSTGKIGSQTLEVIRSYPNKFRIIGLACGHQSPTFKSQIKEFKPKIISIAEKDGEEAIVKVATHPEVELVIVAVVGMAGLAPTLAAIRAGKDVALATKEVLVIAGELVMREVKKHKVKLIPLDSEHSAIFQCLATGRNKEIEELILTMGKGPIAKKSKSQLKRITVKDVLKRKTWTMGKKISVDSATCMNKVFEVIEAHWLFGVPSEKIKIAVHPEYLCHSAVKFVDGSIIAEIGVPDMRRYLQYALFYPQRRRLKFKSHLDLMGKKLTFEEPAWDKFPCLDLGYESLKKGGTMPAAMHGADTVAVEAFLQGEIGFLDIPLVIKNVMKKHKPIKRPSLDQIIQAEKECQILAKKYLRRKR